MLGILCRFVCLLENMILQWSAVMLSVGDSGRCRNTWCGCTSLTGMTCNTSVLDDMGCCCYGDLSSSCFHCEIAW